jgi:hypothetical protein
MPFGLLSKVVMHIPQQLCSMMPNKTLDLFWLWSDIVGYYDTDINRANIDVKCLLNLQLDPDVTLTSFIANFRECLLCLQKHNAKWVEDTDALHALLLVIIQKN